MFYGIVPSNEGAIFRAGHAGRPKGGKIVFEERGENLYSIVISRLNQVITLENGDIELIIPRAGYEVPF